MFRLLGSGRGAPERDFPLGYSAALDGARGLMTLGVLAAHLHYFWYPGAIIFMDTFFVMSSYLITSLLLKDYAARGRVDFRRFYVRRVRRLYPALICMLSIYALAITLLQRPLGPEIRAIAAALLYYMNWARAFEWPMSTYLGHTWSLAIEEQFYILWPVLFAVVMRLRTHPALAIASLLFVAMSSAAWRMHLAQEGASYARMYNGTDVRLDGLCLGAALAFAVYGRHGNFPPRLTRALSWATPAVAVVLFFAGFYASYYDRAWYVWHSQVCIVLSTVLVAGLIICRNTLLHPLLESTPTVFLGKICYGLYIWHFPIFVVMEDHLKVDLATRVAFGLPMVFIVATLSYYWIELPFMSRRSAART